MKVVILQAAPWDQEYLLPAASGDWELGGYYVVSCDNGQELLRLVEERDLPDSQAEKALSEHSLEIIRQATSTDLAQRPKADEERRSLDECYMYVKKLGLEMKLVDCRISQDRRKITFAFVANGRVDFRELVKELSRHFNKSIRLQQIGVRDEAKMMGDQGRCGRRLCCGHLNQINSVTGDMAEKQALQNRGSDRLSGACGRLMCCLAYEVEGYQELSKKIPPLGTKVNVDGKKGVVVGANILKETVDVRFEGGKGEDAFVTEIDLNRHKDKPPHKSGDKPPKSRSRRGKRSKKQK